MTPLKKPYFIKPGSKGVFGKNNASIPKFLLAP